MKKVLLSLCCLCAGFSLFGQDYQRLSLYEEELFGSKMHVNGSFDAMRQVRQYWNQEYARLKVYDKYQIALCGDGEAVFKVTMPTSLLFEANEPTLLSQADGILRPLLRLLRGKEAMASVVVACCSDNNGSADYLDNFTRSRARAICSWLEKQGVEVAIYGYGIGNHVPLNGNGTLAEREENRRVTLYLVPNRQMMKLAKKGKLATDKSLANND
ncbi:MAG: hypothetical protein J6W69_03715 [Bacteroidales bacterium]|nr:hypothetical protein [Bacteroidales bacterium]